MRQTRTCLPERLLKMPRGLVGTPGYMAPEQARGEPSGAAVDVYGVAALALELLTGKPPYDCVTPQGLLTALLTQAPSLPSARGLCVPELDAVFVRGLHTVPGQRPATAGEFVNELAHVFERAELHAGFAAGQVVTDSRAVSGTAPQPATLESSRDWRPSAAKLGARGGLRHRRSLASELAQRFAACAAASLSALRQD